MFGARYEADFNCNNNNNNNNSKPENVSVLVDLSETRGSTLCCLTSHICVAHMILAVCRIAPYDVYLQASYSRSPLKPHTHQHGC